jgi:hypothetical protein
MLRPILVELVSCTEVDAYLACKLRGHDYLLYCAQYGLKSVLSSIEFYLREYDLERLYIAAMKCNQDEIIPYIIQRMESSTKKIIKEAIIHDYSRIFQIMGVRPDDYLKLIIQHDSMECLMVCSVNASELKALSIGYSSNCTLKYALQMGAVVTPEDFIFASHMLDWNKLNILYDAAPHLLCAAIDAAAYDLRSQTTLRDLLAYKNDKVH